MHFVQNNIHSVLLFLLISKTRQNIGSLCRNRIENLGVRAKRCGIGRFCRFLCWVKQLHDFSSEVFDCHI